MCPHSKTFDPKDCPLCILWNTRDDYRRVMESAGIAAGGAEGIATAPYDISSGSEEGVTHPGMGRKALNAAKAAGKIVWRSVQGKPVFVSLEVLNERRSVCDGCEMLDGENDVCMHTDCGCFLSRKLSALGVGIPGKLEIASESCPAGKWKSVE